MHLPTILYYCQNQIAIRFLRAPIKNKPLLITIPGGAALSGRYLDHFLFTLAKQININVAILDLPNHGDSILPTTQLPLSYQKCFNLVDDALRELTQQTEKLILFGQSFGARLAFDLLSFSQASILGGFLTGFPYKFQMSRSMQERIASLDLTSSDLDPEEIFRKNWMKIIPLYTFSPLTHDISEALVTNTKLHGNEYILDDVPDIKYSVEALLSKSIQPCIAILQGDVDGVVPDDNFTELKRLLPQAHFYEIENCGHFPMVESSEITAGFFSKFYSLLRVKDNEK